MICGNCECPIPGCHYEGCSEASKELRVERDALAAQLAAARALLLEDWEHSRFDAALYPDGSLRPFATQWTRDLYAFLWPEGKKL